LNAKRIKLEEAVGIAINATQHGAHSVYTNFDLGGSTDPSDDKVGARLRRGVESAMQKAIRAGVHGDWDVIEGKTLGKQCSIKGAAAGEVSNPQEPATRKILDSENVVIFDVQALSECDKVNSAIKKRLNKSMKRGKLLIFGKGTISKNIKADTTFRFILPNDANSFSEEEVEKLLTSAILVREGFMGN